VSHLDLTKPAYVHDCATCVFLGRYYRYLPGDPELKEYDLYFHQHENRAQRTVIARFSDSGPDYTSGLESGSLELVEAMRRVIRFGIPVTPPVSAKVLRRTAVLYSLIGVLCTTGAAVCGWFIGVIS